MVASFALVVHVHHAVRAFLRFFFLMIVDMNLDQFILDVFAVVVQCYVIWRICVILFDLVAVLHLIAVGLILFQLVDVEVRLLEAVL